jgi:hypothetical protein
VVGWSPYHYGHWAWVSPWGWTWVDDAPWGFAPFHYGRWVFVGGYWGWVPGPIAIRPVYAPALVAFVGGRHFSLAIGIGGGVGVGWFPLGPREVYVPSYRVSPAYVQNVNTSSTTVNNTYVTNVYNNQMNIRNTNINNTDARVSNIKYVNQSVPGAVTAVPQSTFASAQSVSTAAVHVDAKQVAAAQVNNTAAVAPVRESVLGGTVSASVNNSVVAKPPASAVDRAVVAKTAPPSPPVPFEKQQQVLAAHPGRPLGRDEVENLRPTTTSAPLVHSNARGVITVDAPKATTSDAATHSGSGKSDQPVSSTPANTGNGQSGNATYNPKMWTPPATKHEGEHDDRPAARENNQPAHENDKPSSSGQPGAVHAAQPNSARPNAGSSVGSTGGSNGSENEREDKNAAGGPANKPQIRDDRPASANTGQPISQPPASADAERDGSRHSNDANTEHVSKPSAERNDRPASANPGTRVNSAPSNADITKPSNTRNSNVAPGYGADSAPAEKPRAVRDDRPPSAGSGRPAAVAPSTEGPRKPANVSNGNMNSNPPPAATRTIYNAPPAPRTDPQVNRAQKRQPEKERREEKKEERREEKREEKKPEKPH